MRRLLLVILALGIAGLAGLVMYRNRSIDQWEARLHIGRHADTTGPS